MEAIYTPDLGMRLAAFMSTTQLSVGELLACYRVPRNAVYTCCGSKDGRLLQRSCHAFAIGRPGIELKGRLVQNN